MYIMWNSVEKGQILKKLSQHGPAGTRTLYSPLKPNTTFFFKCIYAIFLQKKCLDFGNPKSTFSRKLAIYTTYQLKSKMRFKNKSFFSPSGAIFTHFYATKIRKMVGKLIFRPKPTSGANFIKIGVGRRTGPFTRLLRSLIFGLLMFSSAGA